MITEKKFNTYLKIQNSGKTNMFDVKMVQILSKGILSKQDILEIMDNYEELNNKFNK